MTDSTTGAKRVDFYVLGKGDAAQFACRLAEKIALMGHRIDVLAGSDSDARRLDDLMWTYRQDSFLPHALAGAATDDEPVVIHGDAGPTGGVRVDVLINLADNVPECAAHAARIAEIMPPDETARRSGRARYKHYRDCGFELKKHDV